MRLASSSYPLPSAELGPSDTVICDNGPFTFDVTQPRATYLWHDGGSQSSITVAREGAVLDGLSCRVLSI